MISPRTSTPEGRGLRLAVAFVEGVVIKVKTLPYNSRPRCYFRAGPRRNMAGGMGRISTLDIYSENSCGIASVADRGQQLEGITPGTAVVEGIPTAKLRRDRRVLRVDSGNIFYVR